MSGLFASGADDVIAALRTARTGTGKDSAIVVALEDETIVPVRGVWVGTMEGIDVVVLDTRPDWESDVRSRESM